MDFGPARQLSLAFAHSYGAQQTGLEIEPIAPDSD
jgi:hypothetical protein